jgi:hypothetical protein
VRKAAPADPRTIVARKHLEVFRHENRQYERLLKLLNSAGTVADRLRQALDEVERASSVSVEIHKVRERIEKETGSKPGAEGEPSVTPARYETNVAALYASNAKLLEAVQQRARENQLIVCRALAMVQGIVNDVGPIKAPDTNFTQRADVSAAA